MGEPRQCRDRADAASRIILIEAADRILPALPARISEATLRLLLDLGVEVRLGDLAESGKRQTFAKLKPDRELQTMNASSDGQ